MNDEQGQHQTDTLAYRRFFEEALEGIIITDGTGTVTHANRRVCDMLGYADGELIGKDIFLILGELSLAEIPGPDEGLLVDYPMQHKYGHALDAEIAIKRTSDERILFTVRDITLRKQAIEERDQYIEQLTILGQVEDELSQIYNVEYVLGLALDATVRLSGASAGFIGLIENGRIQLAQSIGYYTDIETDDDALNTPLFKRLIQDEKARLIRNVNLEPAYVRMNEETQSQMILPMMSYERLVGVINLETSHQDRFTYETFEFLKLIAARVAVAVENAQLYKIAQDQLNQLQDLYMQVSELEKLKTDMIRIAAHDLRNPVSVIVGYSELMRRTFDETNTQKYGSYLAMIERSATRMEKITTDILSLERIEKMQSGPGDILPFEEIVHMCYADYKHQAAAKSQAFELDNASEAVYVQGDEAQIREAVTNLITNAIKYTPEEGKIEISLKVENAQAVFKVVDNGFGIQEDQQANLFQPFFRARSTETAQIEGTGLGLYLIKNIIQRHGGSMIFDSEYSKGSTFGFRFPIADPNKNED